MASFDAGFGLRDEKPSSRLWIWSVLLGLALAALPSLKIARLLHVHPPMPVPTTVRAGLPFTVADADDEVEALDVDGVALSRIKGRRLFLGAVGLDDHDSLTLNGLLRQSRRPFEDGPIGWLYSSPVRVFAGVIQVEKPAGPEAGLRLPAALALRAWMQNQERLGSEAEKLRKLLERVDGEADAICWQMPLLSAVSAEFGRMHPWVESRAPVGTQVKASGPGQVEFAGELLAPGKTEIIYHGGGLFSRYLHLGELTVGPGDRVSGGQQVGLSGATGQTEYPLARWDVYWKGKAINPIAFLDLSRQICAPPVERARAPAAAPARAEPKATKSKEQKRLERRGGSALGR